MHLTLKREATKPAARNVLQQQARSDTFGEQYNAERPHEALAMKVPADVYAASTGPCHGPATLEYPLHDWTATVTTCAAFAIGRATSTSVRCLQDSSSASGRSASASGS
jgi:hypothetical protein